MICYHSKFFTKKKFFNTPNHKKKPKLLIHSSNISFRSHFKTEMQMKEAANPRCRVVRVLLLAHYGSHRAQFGYLYARQNALVRQCSLLTFSTFQMLFDIRLSTQNHSSYLAAAVMAPKFPLTMANFCEDYE